MEIPRLHLDGVDAKIGHIDIARAISLSTAARVDRARTPVADLIAAAVAQRKAGFPFTDARELAHTDPQSAAATK
jgi:hypothetical protein